MDLLKEAKKSNKEAYLSLIDKYSTIFYKVARVYFFLDMDIYNSIELALTEFYHGIINIKTEREFLCQAIKHLISTCEEMEKKLPPEINADNDDDGISPNKNTKYKMYKSDSIVEKCMTSLNKEEKIPALLYFYADLTINEIASITNLSKNEVKKRINNSKNNIFDTLDKEEANNGK